MPTFPADTSTITVDVTGVEDDPFFDDPLPGFNHVWAQGQNWGEGGQTGSGSDSNIAYTLNYTIACARRTSVVPGSSPGEGFKHLQNGPS